MATKLKFPKEALLRYLSIYISIAENKDSIKLYVGKTGNNRVEDFYIKKYDHGGLSNGKVSREFWNKEGKNFLKERFKIIRRIRNSS